MSAIWIILLSVLIILACFFAFKRNTQTIIFFLLVVMFQNLIEVIFVDSLTSTINTLFSLIKELMLYLCVFIFILKNREKKIQINLFLAVIIIIGLKNVIITSAPSYAVLISVRMSLVPILCLSVGQTISVNSVKLKQLVKFILYYSFWLALLGIVELIFSKYNFWGNIGFGQFLAIKESTPSWALLNGLSVNFYTWDLGGKAVRRLVSITADPLATAHLVFLGLMIILCRVSDKAYFSHTNLNKVCMGLVIVIACILSFSKAIYAFIIISLILCYLFRKKIAIGKIFGIIGFCAIFVALLVGPKILAGNSSATQNHLTGLLAGFLNAGLFGNGMGTAGTLAQEIGNNSIIVTESYFGVLVYQLGYIGFIAYIGFFVTVLRKLLKLWDSFHNNFTLMCIILLVCIMLEMFLSESSVSIMGTGIYFILIGIATNDKIYNKVENRFKINKLSNLRVGFVKENI